MHLLMHGCISQQKIVFLAALKAVAIFLSLFCSFSSQSLLYCLALQVLFQTTQKNSNSSCFSNPFLFGVYKTHILFKTVSCPSFTSRKMLTGVMYRYILYVLHGMLQDGYGGISWGKIYWLLLLSIVTLAASAWGMGVYWTRYNVRTVQRFHN